MPPPPPLPSLSGFPLLSSPPPLFSFAVHYVALLTIEDRRVDGREGGRHDDTSSTPLAHCIQSLPCAKLPPPSLIGEWSRSLPPRPLPLSRGPLPLHLIWYETSSSLPGRRQRRPSPPTVFYPLSYYSGAEDGRSIGAEAGPGPLAWSFSRLLIRSLGPMIIPLLPRAFS